MNATIRNEYARQRKYWNAKTSLRHARIKDAFSKRDDVRLVWLLDREAYDDSYIDTWADQTEKQREHARKELWETIEREGVWGLTSERRCPCCGHWEQVDSCWGFVGQDANGYEYDIMQTALEAAPEHF